MFGGRGVGAGSVAVLVVLVLVLWFGGREDGGAGGGDARGGATTTAHVARVVDGDTIEVDLDSGEEDVRYIGIDTPESVKPDAPVECFGPEASRRNHELVEGRRVRLVFDRERRDDYGRLLAYVYVGDEFINAELIAGGYARTLEIEPNTAHASELARLQQQAADAGRGMWAAC